MRVAIVGTSHNMTENEERDVRQTIEMILSQRDPYKTIIISGGAKGVDTIAQEITNKLGYRITEFLPATQNWEDKNGKRGYKSRNLIIAQECDELYCITTQTKTEKCYHHNPKQNHQKTAGCNTANFCKKMKKPTHLVVV